MFKQLPLFCSSLSRSY